MARAKYYAIISEIDTSAGDASIDVYSISSTDAEISAAVKLNELGGIDLSDGDDVIIVFDDFSATNDDGWLKDVEFVISDEFRGMRFVKSTPSSAAYYRDIVVMYLSDEERDRMIDEYCAAATSDDEEEFEPVQDDFDLEPVSLVYTRPTGPDAYEDLGIGDETWISDLLEYGRPTIITTGSGGNG